MSRSDNADKDIVFSSITTDIDGIYNYLRKNNKKVYILGVEGGFHSTLMNKAAAKYANYIKNFTFKKPICKVISNYTAKEYTTVDEIVENLILQINNTVKWRESMSLFNSNDIAIDVGPKSVVKDLANSNISGIAFSLLYEYEYLHNLLLDYQNLTVPKQVLAYCAREVICTPNISQIATNRSKINQIYQNFINLINHSNQQDNIIVSEVIKQLKEVYRLKGISELETKYRLEKIALTHSIKF